VRSEAVCAAYWNCHEKTKQTIQGHWICTGDKFHQDGGGHYWFDGRADDMPSIRPWRKLPLGRTKMCWTSRWRGSFLRAGFNGDAELAKSLQEFVVSRLPSYKRPLCVKFVPELPKTATCKIQGFKLRQGSANF